MEKVIAIFDKLTMSKESILEDLNEADILVETAIGGTNMISNIINWFSDNFGPIGGIGIFILMPLTIRNVIKVIHNWTNNDYRIKK